MFRRLYRRVYSDENLTEAWHKVRVRSNSDTAGVDGVTISQFQRYLFSNLKTLQRDLRRRRYRPQPVKRIYISKPDGSKRPLGILTVRDRIVQRAVLNVIEPLFEADFVETSYGFRPGRSVEMALEQVARLAEQGHEWVVDLDIEDFFESINLKKLYALIAKKVKDRELRRIIRSWLEAETVTVQRNGLLKREEARGLLQGGVISPLLANVYLDRFDKLAHGKGLKVVRYADDILILCRTERQARRALKLARKLLAKLDLKLNPHKTQIVHLERGLSFLGETLLLEPGARGHRRLMRLVEQAEAEIDQLQEQESREQQKEQEIAIDGEREGRLAGPEPTLVPILPSDRETEGEERIRRDGHPLHHRAGRYPDEG